MAPDGRRDTAPDRIRGGWQEAAFDALDVAALLVDESFGVVACNARWRQRFLSSEPLRAGALVEDALMRLALTCPDLGADVEDRVKGLLDLMRAFVRDHELHRRDTSPLLLSATPTRDGHTLVTLRDPDRGRLVEERALRLIHDSMASVDMGMTLWDAGLILRMANDAWSRLAGPATPGERADTLLARLSTTGLIRPETGAGANVAPTDLLVEAHQRPSRWELARADGRHVRISTFPTQGGGVLAVAIDITERRDAETRLREMLEEIVDSLAEGVALFDADLKLQMSNGALHRLAHRGRPPLPHGASLSDYLVHWARSGALLVPEDGTLETVANRLAAAIGANAQAVPLAMTDGAVLELSSHPTTGGGRLVTLRDVTEERRAAEADARTRMIVECMGEGMALYDSDLRMRMNNPAFRRMVFDDLPLSAPGTHVLDEVRNCIDAGTIAAPEDRDAVLAWILDCIRDHRRHVELPMGDGRTLEVSNFGMSDGGYLIVMRDITERKQAERKAHEADLLVRTIVEASPTTFLVTRFDDGTVVFASPLSHERFGDLETAKSLFLDPSDRHVYLDALSRTGTLDDYPVTFRRGDGSLMHGLTSARIIEFGGERLIVSSTRDITDQLALQAELERQKELAFHNEKLSALGGLLAGVAHELNNPLSIVLANAAMLQEDATDPVTRKRVDRIATAAERSGRIIKTFLAMARNRPARIEVIAVDEMIATALDIADYGLRSLGAAIVRQSDGRAPRVAVDADQLVQALCNLIVNAEHAIRPLGAAGRLVIADRTRDGIVRIEISDNGPGVPKDLRRRCFEPYFTTKEIGEGTGIGLAYCHRVVTAHGGSIAVDDASSGGACFRIDLPAARSPHAPTDASPERQPCRGRILVVDDELDVVETVAEALTRGGYDVSCATSVSQALAACRATGFDAIVSDLRMPGEDGLDLLDALARTRPELARRLGFMTGDAMGLATGRSVTASGRPYLEKPVSPEDVLNLVAGLIGTADDR